MAISHVCLGCGLDLALVRPIRDVHYGLPLVICPRCDAACVRRRHPLQHSWRSFLRVRKSLCTMFWHIMVLSALLGFNIAAIAFAPRLAEMPLDEAINDYRSEVILCFVVVPIITGMWLTAGLRHCRRWFTFGLWMTLVGAIISLQVAAHFIGRWFNIEEYISDHPARLIAEWTAYMVMFGVMMIMALAGIPVGHMLHEAYARHRRHYWRKRLRKARARRRGG
jgi:hypothetical protein